VGTGGGGFKSPQERIAALQRFKEVWISKLLESLV
jgi:hypothetical protein